MTQYHYWPVNVMYPQYDINHVTIIMEGPIRYSNIYQTVASYRYLCKEIILCSYVTEQQIIDLKKIASNIVILNHNPEVVENETKLLYPQSAKMIKKGLPRKGFQQFYHMKFAIPIVKTAFVLKTRTDQVFSNLDIAIKLMYANDDKVVMFPYYIRGSLKCKYHAADQMFGCTTKKMKEIWLKYHVPSECYDKNMLVEIALWKGWMDAEAKRLGYGDDVKSLSHHDYGVFCSKLFLVLNERKHKPFKVGGRINYSACSQKYIWHENESMEKNTYNYFSGKGCDLGF